MMDFEIRKYESGDRERVRWICCETGFMGEPVEKFLLGREIFADTRTLYWTDFEPESSFVAEVEGKVVGYLLGCLDTLRQREIFAEKIRPGIIRKSLLSSFFFRGRNWQYLLRVIRSWMRGEFRGSMKKFLVEYPAHLHTNIAPAEFRGRGIGKALIQAYLDYLRERRSKGVHLVTTSMNHAALKLYYGMGFKDLSRSRLTCYDHIIAEPLEKIVMGLKLGAGG